VTGSVYPNPPEWVRRGARVLVDAAELEPDDKGRRPYDGEGEFVAIVMHVGDPLTGKRSGGPVWLRREGGGPEITARGKTLRRAPGDLFDGRLIATEKGTGA
jgi:hypothetical protein